jgi:hypothetical protein
MPRIKPSSKVLELETYSSDRPMIFSFAGPKATPDSNDAVCVPISIAFRLYHLGRAYDFQSIKLIHPSGVARLDFSQRELVISELSKIRVLVNDPVVEHYLGMLLPYL